MKKLLLALLILLPMVASAMKIEKDEIDEFTGNRTIITSWENSNTNRLRFRFRLQNGHEVLDVIYYGSNVMVAGKDELLLFKSTEDHKAAFKCSTITSSSLRQFNGYCTFEATYNGDISWFGIQIPRLVRIYYSDAYVDIKLSETEGKKLSMLYDLYKSTKEGEVGVQKYANYKLQYLKKRTKENSWDLVKEEYRECLSEQELLDIMNEWRAKSDDKTQYEVKPKKTK